jgi:hypothetical protein
VLVHDSAITIKGHACGNSSSIQGLAESFASMDAILWPPEKPCNMIFQGTMILAAHSACFLAAAFRPGMGNYCRINQFSLLARRSRASREFM